MQTIKQKIETGDTLSDVEMFAFFDIANRYNALHVDRGLKFDSDYHTDLCELLSDIDTRYDYGGDVCFWISGNYFIDRQSEDQWFVEDKSSSDNDDTNTVAGNAIAAHYGDNTSIPDALSLFGLDHLAHGYLDIADDDYDDNCKIWVSANHYIGSLTTQKHSNWVSDNDGDALIFNSYASAKNWISRQSDGIYVLSNTESSPPDYYITEA